MKKITSLFYILSLMNFISFTAHAQTYCSSKGSNTSLGYIKEVKLSCHQQFYCLLFDNISGNNGGYGNFTNIEADVVGGLGYSLDFTPGYIGGNIQPEYFTIYIDFNHNGVFEPGELVGKKGIVEIRKNILFGIPTTALNGPTRMRIQMQEGSFETDPCATFTNGEVEDYTLDISGNAASLLQTNARVTQTNSYCTSKGTNTTHGYIKKVSMETINNTSGNNGGYADFTAQSANLLRGATYTIELTPGFNPNFYLEYWTVYIDYNQNGMFEPSEIVGEKHNYIRVNKSFTIPATALNGPTRMRIQMQAGAQETNPCATYTYGEVEDYTVVIAGNAARVAETNPDFKNITGENTTDFRLYPNPAKNNLMVEFTGSSYGNVKVNVYNLSGQKVMNIVNPSVKGLNTFKLNSSKLGPGFYILEIENNGQRQHQKFLISR